MDHINRENSPSHVGSYNMHGSLSHSHDEAFANFQMAPPRSSNRLRYFHRKGRYQAMASLSASKEKLCGSYANLFGSTQDLEPSTVLNLAEDARSRKITAEVMKHRLYESVITSPRRRRLSTTSNSMYDPQPRDFYSRARMVQSMPVTPAHSENPSPYHSPTSQRKMYFGFYSRAPSPTQEHCIISDEDDDSDKGLESILNPEPRHFRSAMSCHNFGNCSNDIEMEEVQEKKFASVTSSDGILLRVGHTRILPPPRKSGMRLHSRTSSISSDLNVISP